MYFFLVFTLESSLKKSIKKSKKIQKNPKKSKKIQKNPFCDKSFFWILNCISLKFHFFELSKIKITHTQFLCVCDKNIFVLDF
jgi:hypothetical protein